MANGQSGVAAPGRFTPQAAFNLQVSYSDSRDFAVAANVAYEVVPGFKIQPEIDYPTTSVTHVTLATSTFDDDDDESNGVDCGLRLQRNF